MAKRVLVFIDSLVVLGAFAKGRSSSFKLNGILRSTLPYLTLGFLEVALIWVSTKANPADHPSRGVALPHPVPVPDQFKHLARTRSREAARLEVFAGVAVLTRTCEKLGLGCWAHGISSTMPPLTF